MAALHPNLRKKLERAVVKARDIAEKAAQDALQALAVDIPKPFDHITEEQCILRDKLRAHAHAIGDRYNQKTNKRDLDRLIRETAYEHWHRMLFARFLAENNLLMHADGVPVTLDECEELATEEGIDKWELASRYAAKMLPAIFRPDDPTLQVEFAPENKLELEKLLADLEPEVFTAYDSLGWVYQFWQSKKKDEVNRSEKKIGADELPAVTQLFTEDYMVKFLLHNSLGAWWAGKFLAKNPQIAKNKDLTEDDLRRAVAFDDYQFDFLRFIFDEEKNTWRPAAGCFEGWPKEAKDITVLDPCCGSGHFLVAAFELMVRIRIAGESLSIKEAIDAVLKDNIFGLEIDARCTQIAAFSLALSAWTYPGAEGYRPLPELNIACSGIPVTAKKEDWLKLANGDEKLKNGMDRLWNLFRQAPILGSLIDPTVGDKHELIEASFDDLQPLLEKALESEKTKADFDLNEVAVAANGIAQATVVLSKKYTLVITNVPYLLRRKQAEDLMLYCDRKYPEANNDLATCFLERLSELTRKICTYVLVMPQNWTFQKTDAKLRKRWLKKQKWNLVARLGPGAFELISGEVVNVSLFVFTNEDINEKDLSFNLDVIDHKTFAEKAVALKQVPIKFKEQQKILKNPDSRYLFTDLGKGESIEVNCKSLQGIVTGDDGRLKRLFWELHVIFSPWIKIAGTVLETKFYGGRESLVLWENDGENIARKQGTIGWGHNGVCINRMSLAANLYTGEPFDINVAAIVPDDQSFLKPLWAFCESPDFISAVKVLDRKLNVTNATIGKVPFDICYWKQVAEEKYPNGLPEPYSDDPTQWIFSKRSGGFG
jgi:hypothetical protein